MRAVIFDFDGVLVESINIKSDAFRSLFKEYPQYLDEFVAYHEYNGGVSRFEKIKYFYKHFLQQDIPEETFNKLLTQFNCLVCDKVVQAPYVAGAKSLLDQLRKDFLLFVVSGTPQDEMREIVERRKMAQYFKGVFGSPRNKTELVNLILKDNKISSDEVVLLGDSVTDLKAAEDNNIRFIARITDGKDFWFYGRNVLKEVKDLEGLYGFISQLI